MALVKFCENQHRNAVNDFVCVYPGCNSFSFGSPIEEGEEMPAMEQNLRPPVPPAQTMPEPQQPLPAQSTWNPPAEATRRDKGYTVRFPFGDFRIDGSLRIGRDPAYSSLGLSLTKLDTVSREHAELRMVNGVLFVICSLKATNGIRINGHVIPPGTPEPLKRGDQIQFSSQLTAVIVNEE